MKSNSLDFFHATGGITFDYEDKFFYFKSSYFIEGPNNDGEIVNSIGIDLTPTQVDELIDLLNEYKDHLSQRNSQNV